MATSRPLPFALASALSLLGLVGAGACKGGEPADASKSTGAETEPETDTQAPSPADMNDNGSDTPTGDASKISFEAIADLPYPGTSSPGSMRFTPDGKEISYLMSSEESLHQQLYRYDLESHETAPFGEAPGGGEEEENLTLEEKLRRERSRSRALGITSYQWATRGPETTEAERMMVPIGGDLYIRQGRDGELQLRLDRKAWCAREGLDENCSILDVRMSKDGSQIAFVADDELYVLPFEGSDEAGPQPKQVTRGARGTGKTHGLAEYIAQEEMSRSHGYWWSPDASSIAFTEVDETHIPVYRIMHQGSDGVGDGHQEDHRYPFAGAANAKVRLGVVAARGGSPKWMDLDIPPEGYLARVDWMPDGSLTAQVENRAQDELVLYRIDPRSGKATPLLEEKSEVWINLHSLLRPLEGAKSEAAEPSPDAAPADPQLAGAFLWGSERTGFMHLYLYDAEGQLIRPVTQGEWMVESIEHVDEATQRVYFTATKDGPLERHLYVVGYGAGAAEPERITREPGMHGVEIDPQGRFFVDKYSSAEQPFRTVLRKLDDGSEVDVIHEAKDDRIAEWGLTAPRFVEIRSRDGVPLHAAIYQPDPARFGPGPYRTMVSVYGGPHAQKVQNAWSQSVDMRAQALRDRGILVFELDNRGSARRGLAFEGAIKRNMGDLEVQDQVDGVNYLVEQKLADPAHVGMYGWSYGGYMSAISLSRAPETFSLAVAGAPVTHWDGYDTHYTERYMGTPENNSEGYEVSSVMAHVEKMTGDLMLVHGLIDENVHFRHTARLIQALIEARKPYELLLFPAERHAPRKRADRIFMEERIWAFIDENL